MGRAAAVRPAARAPATRAQLGCACALQRPSAPAHGPIANLVSDLKVDFLRTLLPYTLIIVFVCKSGRQMFRMFKSGWHFKSGRYILTKCLFGIWH